MTEQKDQSFQHYLTARLNKLAELWQQELRDFSQQTEQQKRAAKKLKARLKEPEIVEQIQKYIFLLDGENQKHNLIGPATKKEIVTRHILDSLAPLIYTAQLQDLTDKIAIDIGTGAGLPGLLWSLFLPESRFYLLDSRKKRVIFLNKAVETLKLSSTFPLRERAEVLGQNKDWRAKFDYSLARAVAPLNVLLEYALPLLQVKGRALFFKGPAYQEELPAARAACDTLETELEQVFTLKIPELKGERYLLSFVKRGPTPEKYPRRVGIPKKRPLTGRS